MPAQQLSFPHIRQSYLLRPKHQSRKTQKKMESKPSTDISISGQAKVCNPIKLKADNVRSS
jgi:hypothetical protein